MDWTIVRSEFHRSFVGVRGFAVAVLKREKIGFDAMDFMIYGRKELRFRYHLVCIGEVATMRQANRVH